MGYLNPHTHNLDDAPAHVVTICGSTKFRAEMAEANRRLTFGGHIVLAPGVFQHDGDEITEQQKAALDRLHFQKIYMSGWVYVVNPGGYIGESTRREIAYAESLDKPVQYLVPVVTAQNTTSPPVDELDFRSSTDPHADYLDEPPTAPYLGAHDGPGVACRRCSSEGFENVHHNLCACGRALPHPPIGGAIKPCQGPPLRTTGSQGQSGGGDRG